MKVLSVLLLWFLGLSTAATAYTQASSETASVSPQEKIVLTWTAPVQRENGSLLSPSELVGYQIYYTVEETGESTMIEIDDTLANMIHDGGSQPQIESYCHKKNQNLRDDGIRKVISGETTLDEVVRVTRDNL